MPFESILQEVQHLNNVSERLESMAPNHPHMEDALLAVSGNIRNIAAFLKVLVIIRQV
jgi:hypothetical protein